MNAATACGCPSAIDAFVGVPFHSFTFGTGSATIAGCPCWAGRTGASGTYGAWTARASPVMSGANAAFTARWMSGTARKLLRSATQAAPCARSCSRTAS